MNLLFITQKIDRDDNILGVYHDWAAKLGQNVSKLSVICLYKGMSELPPNVSIYSLGKERGLSKSALLLNFYKYIFNLRNNYDVVFVHMNPAYIILGWLFWKIWRKPTVYWNASYKISPLMKLGLFFANRGVTSVPEAFNVKSRKIMAVGQGIDTSRFRRDEAINRQPNSLLFLGRISPVKNPGILIEAMKILHSKGVNAGLSVVGSPVAREEDEIYYENIKKKAAGLEKEGFIKFQGSIPFRQTPHLYNLHWLFVNLTESGSFDKSILEAMACQTLILISNRIYERIFDEDLRAILMFKEKDSADLASKIENLLKLPDKEYQATAAKLRKIIVNEHNLDNLIFRLVKIFSSLL